MLEFIVYGEPKGKGRPRFNRRTGTAYSPTATKDYEDLVRLSFINTYKGVMSYGMQPYGMHIPLKATIEAFYALPKSGSRARKSRMLANVERPTKKPDTDNIAKIILDALNGLAYHDDAQIVELNLIKCYGEIPCVRVKIEEV